MKPLSASSDQRRAHRAVGRAIKSGKMLKQPCETCGTRRSPNAHHDDYLRPLDVRWLCASCHQRQHRLNIVGADRTPIGLRINATEQNDIVEIKDEFRFRLQSLAEEDRSIVVWRLAEGLTLQQIAYRLGVSRQAAEQRLYRIIKESFQ
jgi:RNA polymerase sigma factor (sigma-70 family)